MEQNYKVSELSEFPKEIKDIKRLKEFSKVTLTNEELNDIFIEGNSLKRNGLESNEVLLEKLKKYDDTQKKIVALRESITKRFLQRYTVSQKNVMKSSSTEIGLYINQKYIGLVDMFWFKKGSCSLSIVRARDFMYMLAASGNPIVSHELIGNEDIYIDFRLWVLDVNGKIDFETEYGKCYMTL